MEKKGNVREKESLVCCLGPQPPSSGILHGPGGEPDGAEQGWGVQGVGGGTSYGPPGLLSV